MSSTNKQTTLLIDGDVVIYRACAAATVSVEWEPGQFSNTSDANQAKQRVDGEIADLMRTLDADDCIVALSDSDNWRKELCPTYKANRTKPKPACYADVVEYARLTYKCLSWPRLEADDVLGILSTGKKIKGRKIVCSVDKDLRTIPGLLFNPGKPELGVALISQDEADYNHLIQALTGDTTDNYPGLPGCGPKGAAKLLDGVPAKRRWDVVRAAFGNKKLTDDDALLQARLARILRTGEYNHTKNTIKLWRAA